MGFGALIADAVPEDRKRYSYPQSRLTASKNHHGAQRMTDERDLEDAIETH